MIMLKPRLLLFTLLVAFFFACRSDDCDGIKEEPLYALDELVALNEVARDSVIACASGSLNVDEVVVYLYPRPMAEEIRYFETENTQVNPLDFQNYTKVRLDLEDLFNGYMAKFTTQTIEEKWVIVTFMENGILNLSTPIRLKHKTQNTIFNNEVLINQSQSGMPLFTWDNLLDPQDAIYFQVVSDDTNKLLSGTYTFETNFRYYDLDNVVLNVTREAPPNLVVGQEYNFTLMGVSEDNWVNTLAQRSFILEP